MGSMVVNGRVASAVSFETEDGTDARGKTASIFTHQRLNAAKLREGLRAAVSEELRIAFSAPSRRQCCRIAARMTGADPSTIERLYEGETASPDAVLIAIIAGHYTMATGKLSKALHLLNMIGGAA